MNRGVCILLLRVLRRGGGGGGGESEDEVTEMTSSGSGSQFLLRRWGGEDSEGEGRKRGVFDARRGGTSDEERREVPACSGRFCHVAYCMRTCRTGIEKHTHLYGVLIMGVIYTHLHVGGDRTLLHGVCITHAHRKTLGWDIPLSDVGLDHDRNQQCASRCHCLVPDLLRLGLHDPTKRGYPCPWC